MIQIELRPYSKPEVILENLPGTYRLISTADKLPGSSSTYSHFQEENYQAKCSWASKL
jgi:hypothetical protein